jgi:hypothetical protein
MILTPAIVWSWVMPTHVPLSISEAGGNDPPEGENRLRLDDMISSPQNQT